MKSKQNQSRPTNQIKKTIKKPNNTEKYQKSP